MVFRNLGPRRSLRKAYYVYINDPHYYEYAGNAPNATEGVLVVRRTTKIKPNYVPYDWRAAFNRYNWHERASAWDVRNLAQYGARVAVNHVEAIRKLSEENLRALRAKGIEKLKPGSREFDAILKSVAQVAGFLTPEIVDGVMQRYATELAEDLNNDPPEPIDATGEPTTIDDAAPTIPAHITFPPAQPADPDL